MKALRSWLRTGRGRTIAAGVASWLSFILLLLGIDLDRPAMALGGLGFAILAWPMAFHGRLLDEP